MTKIVTYPLILMFLTSALFSQEGEWQEIEGMPESRVGHAAALIENTIYISGGISGGGHGHGGRHDPERQLWAYDTESDSWDTDLPELPEGRTEHVMLATGDSLLIFGGNERETIFSEVLLWVEGNDTWQSISTMPVPRTEMSAFLRDGRIFLVGGKASTEHWAQPTAYVDSFDPTDLSWIAEDSLEQARANFAIAANGDSAFCMGGRVVDPIPSVELMAETGAWNPSPPLPAARSNCAGVFFEDAIIVIGGLESHGLAQENFFWEVNSWSSFEPNLIPRFDPIAIATSDAIYVMGGRSGHHTLNSVEMYIPPVNIENTPVIPQGVEPIAAYPNPFNGSVRLDIGKLDPGYQNTFQLSIFDLRGQLISTRVLSFDELKVLELDENDFKASGTYLLVLEFTLANGQPRRSTSKLSLLK